MSSVDSDFRVERSQAEANKLPYIVLGAAVGVIGLVQLAVQLALASRGLDLTDEGYYLSSLRYPESYPISTTRFGALMAPVMSAAGGDIVLLRRIALLAVFITSVLLTMSALRLLASRTQSAQPPAHLHQTWLQVALAIGSASAASLVFYRVLLTPNYNVLGLLTIQWALIGALAGAREWPGRQIWMGRLGWLVVGVSLGLCTINKPTSGPLVAVLLLVLLASLRALSWARFGGVLLVAAGTIAILAQVISGSLSEFVTSTKDGARIVAMLGHSTEILFNLPSFVPSQRNGAVASAGAAVMVASAFSPRRVAWLLLSAPALSAFLVWRIARGIGGGQSNPTQWILLSVVIGTVLVAGVRWWRRPSGFALRWSAAVGAAALALLPFAWAFGTNNDLIEQAGQAGYLWLLSAIWILASIDRRLAISTIGLAQILALLVISGWYAAPYRQTDPIARQSHLVRVGPDLSEVMVSDFGPYLEELERAGDNNTPPARTALIDLTGQSPLATFALGAISLGTPWSVGGYPGSEDAFAEYLSQASCQNLTTAWILSTKGGGGPRALNPAALGAVGLDFPAEYARVRRFHEPTEGLIQLLWRPRNGSETCDE